MLVPHTPKSPLSSLNQSSTLFALNLIFDGLKSKTDEVEKLEKKRVHYLASDPV